MLEEIEIVKPADIEKRSMEIITSELGGRTWPEPEFSIVKRCIHTAADFDYADNLCFSENAIASAIGALTAGATIVTDTQMAAAGINKKTLAQFGGQVRCFMSDEAVAARAKVRGVTRASICMEEGAKIDGPLIFAIGNAPTALIRLYEMIQNGEVKPDLIIGVPVGFVNVVESKELIMKAGVPYIVARGRKGGSNIAAAICNALLYYCIQNKDMGVQTSNTGINLKKASETFQKFMSQYDIHDDMIKLKVVHTMAVRNSCEYIAKHLGLDDEDVALAVLIGLLHDVARFDQAVRFKSFNDVATVDHAILGVRMLFGDWKPDYEKNRPLDAMDTEKWAKVNALDNVPGPMIRMFVEDDRYDQIIYDAILNHNRFAIMDGLDERTLLHAKIIRDADKLDNYRVKLEDPIQAIIGYDEDITKASPVTDRVYEDSMHRRSVFSPTRRTSADIWMSYFAATFDIYFKASLELIAKNHWIEKMADRIHFTNPDTHKKMQDVQNEVLNFINERIEQHD